LITAAEITVLFNYFQLCGEDHRWWWRAFANGGGTALWVLLYAISYFKTLETNEAATYFLYFGYMFLLCMAAFLALGFVGLATSLHFNKTIFASVKID
jgi:transmembrane 9 superfamily protein 2/4